LLWATGKVTAARPTSLGKMLRRAVAISCSRLLPSYCWPLRAMVRFRCKKHQFKGLGRVNALYSIFFGLWHGACGFFKLQGLVASPKPLHGESQIPPIRPSRVRHGAEPIASLGLAPCHHVF